MSGSKIAENPLRRCWRKVKEEVAQPSYKAFVERLRVAETPADGRIIMVETLKTLQAGYSRAARSAACDGVDFSDLGKLVATLNRAIGRASFKSQRYMEEFGDLFSDNLADLALGPSPAESCINPAYESKQGIATLFRLTGGMAALGGLLIAGPLGCLKTSSAFLLWFGGFSAILSAPGMRDPFPDKTQIEIPYPDALEKFY